MNKIILSIGITLILTQISCIRYVNFNVMQSGDVIIPNHIQKIALINRAIPSDKKTNTIESIITGEMIGQDKQGRIEIINGVQQILSQSNRFQYKIDPKEYIGTPTGGEWPIPFSDSAIDSICQKNEVDGIIVIEKYDSDCVIGAANLQIDYIEQAGIKVPIPKYYVKQIATVKAGFRFYDRKNKSIIDQFNLTHLMNWNTNGSSPGEAISSIIQRTEYMNTVSFQCGKKYGKRISPNWIRVSRKFFTNGGHPDMKVARRRADVGDWEGAKQIWERLSSENKGRNKGKAMLNLSVMHELFGDVYKAKEVAQKAYTDYNIRIARDYVQDLNWRIREIDRLNQP